MAKQTIAQRSSAMAQVAIGILLGAISMTATANGDPQNEQVIEARQQDFKTIEKNMKQLARALDAKDLDWSRLNTWVNESRQAASDLQTAFPVGSDDGSRAKSAVWNKPAKFNNLMAQMEQGYDDMLKAVANKNTAFAKQGLKQAGGTCKGCHRQYRSLW
ncbi:cytochrome c [Photobacterium sagamiensis]|uniref:c-type cytochrome n=1 Tax=Photobacterium sagamiensis TaxID=2910241 RepID=UPI003D0FCEE3